MGFLLVFYNSQESSHIHCLSPSQIIPADVRGRWQEYLETMGSSLADVTGREISSLVVTLETPDSILVVCTAGQSNTSHIVLTLCMLKWNLSALNTNGSLLI